MECPVCGAKMVDDKICKYCGTTNAQVLGASNLKAKQALKQGNKQDVCYSKTMPSDVDKKKLMLLTVFLGYAGAGNFYVGKTVKAWVNLVSFVLGLTISIFLFIGDKLNWGVEVWLQLALDFVCIFAAISLMMWFFDIVALLFKRYKVPVVLGEDEVKTKVRAKRRK